MNMGPKLEQFLNQFKEYLIKLPENERTDIQKEIKSHIMESLEKGKNEDQILARLGDPKELAKGYVGEFLTQKKSNKVSGLFERFAFLMSINLISAVISVLLAAVCFVFGLATAVFFFTSAASFVLTSFNQTNIVELYHLPSLSELPITLLLGVVFGLISFGFIKLNRLYFKISTEKYRKATLKRS
jgi:uncharacterized membrane protein